MSSRGLRGGAPDGASGGGQRSVKPELGTVHPALPAQHEPSAAGKFLGGISALAQAHLAALVGIALYLAYAHPAGRGPVAIVSISAVLVVLIQPLLPAAWRALALGEAAIVATALLVSLGWWPDPSLGTSAERNIAGETLHGLVGMTIAALFLAPPRFGWLPLIVLLALIELVWLGSRPGSGLTAASAASWLVPGAAVVLGASAWLTVGRGRRGRSGAIPTGDRFSWLAWMRWAAVPTLIVAACGLVIGNRLETLRPVPQVAIQQRSWMAPAMHPSVGGTDPSKQPSPDGSALREMRFGDRPGIDRNDTVRARLTWTSGDPKTASTGVLYLRGLALSRMEVAGPIVVWTPIGPPDRAVPDRFPAGQTATLWRARGGGDPVLRLDGAPAVALSNLLGDAEGNRFRRGFGDRDQIHAVALGTGESESTTGSDPAACREIPSALAYLPWADIEDPRWKDQPAHLTATAICKVLADRCTYAVNSLPEPAPGPAGALATFLFGREAQRRGHCQYFSTAAAILLRRAGMPERCVIGYASDEIDGVTATFRSRHAHAWLEIASGDRWLRVDPTPGNEPVAGADTVATSEPGAPAQLLPPPTPPGIPEPPAKPDNPLDSAATEALALPWLAATAVIFGAALAASWLLSWILGRRPAPNRPAHAAALDRRAADLLRLATELGLPVTPATTLANLADGLAQRTGMDLARHRDAHLSCRFGNGPLPPPWPIAELRALGRAKARRSRSAR